MHADRAGDQPRARRAEHVHDGPHGRRGDQAQAHGPGFFSYSLGYYYNPATGGRHTPGRKNVFRDYINASSEAEAVVALQERRGFLSEQEIAAGEPKDEVQRALYRAARSGNAIGSTKRLRETLQLYEDQHLDTMIFVVQAGDRRHEHIMESIETFGKELLPEFKERHEQVHRPWRAEQLRGVDFPINSSI